jgi:hypothetical protein
MNERPSQISCSILMLAIVATTILLMIFPDIPLWLPHTMR